jgi:hypothetical protein
MNASLITVICLVAGLCGCAVGLAIDPKSMLASYLAGWIALSAISIGSIGVLPFTYLVRGGWTNDLHRPLMLAALTLPIFALLFLPILLGCQTLYPWVDAAPSLPTFQRVWLSPWFFSARATFYFVVLFVLAVWLAFGFLDERSRVRSASATTIGWSLIVSFAGIDWLESLEPHFHSSMYGLLMLSFALLTGLAFALAFVLIAHRDLDMQPWAYSGLFLSMLLLWAYLHAMQYIIIWSGNLPDEMIWYVERLKGPWGVLLWALFILQFFVPFFALLPAWLRYDRRNLLWIALATLTLRYLEAVILILPPLHVGKLVLLLDLPAALLLIASGFALAWTVAERFDRRLFLRTAAV